IPDDIGTAVNVQMMVSGNTGDRSATGVGFTRNPATGKKEFYGEFWINAQGEDVVGGIRMPQPMRELEQVRPKADKQRREITTRGLPASPGAASGQVVFTADDAVAWSQQGKPVILVRRETVPDDIHGMFVAQGILTATGGMTSHAAVVGRQMGKPSVVGAGALEIHESARQFRVGGQTVKEGDFISFDGLTGDVKIAQVASKPSEILQVVAGTRDAKKSD